MWLRYAPLKDSEVCAIWTSEEGVGTDLLPGSGKASYTLGMYRTCEDCAETVTAEVDLGTARDVVTFTARLIDAIYGAEHWVPDHALGERLDLAGDRSQTA